LSDHKFTRLPFAGPGGKSLGLNLDHFIEWKGYFLITPWKAEQKPSLILYNHRTRKITDVYSENSIVSMFGDHLGRIWISFSNGIRLVDTAMLEKGLLRFVDPPENYRAFRNKGNVNLFVDSKENLWFYANNRIEKLSARFRLDTIAAGRNLSAGGNLANMFEDRENMIWVATDGNGAIKLEGTNLQFFNELKSVPLQASAIQQTGDTTWLFNMTNNSICRLENNSVQIFHLGLKLHMPANIFVIGNKLLVSDQNRILSIRNKDDPNSYRHPEIFLKLDSPDYSLSDGLVDPYGSIIIIGAETDSIFSLIVVRNNKVIFRLPVAAIPDHLKLDKKGRLWLVTRDNHLVVLGIHPGKQAEYLQPIRDYAGEFPNTSPRSIALDTNGNVWIGTRFDGIFRLQFDGDSIRSVSRLSTLEGLTDNFIYTLHCDQQNNLWAGTQTGLDKITFRNGNFTISNISRNNNFFQSIYRIASRGNIIWAQTREGTLFKIISSRTDPPAPPPVLVTLSKVNGNPGSSPTRQFPYYDNNLLFNVAAPSFTDEKSVRYSYQLQGSGNSRWSDPSREASLNFINLPPGKYNLLVRAEFPESMYPAQQSSLSFIILPPWWQTWWFRAMSVVLLTVVIVIIIKAYVGRKLEKQRMALEKQQAIQMERTRIATDMHDDLGSGLSSIRFLSEKVKRNTFSEVSRTDVDKILISSAELIDKMNEIVWAMNEKNDTLADLLTYIRAYAKEYCEENGLSCEIFLPDMIPDTFVSGEFRRNIFLTIKESLHNIIKHSGATRAELSFLVNAGFFASIRDNGKGFDLTEAMKNSSGNGLKNMRKRIESIGGKFSISSGEGILIEIGLPLPL
jgi:signal transduction histidine kinase